MVDVIKRKQKKDMSCAKNSSEGGVMEFESSRTK
jgi:hypothetical protein